MSFADDGGFVVAEAKSTWEAAVVAKWQIA